LDWKFELYAKQVKRNTRSIVDPDEMPASESERPRVIFHVDIDSFYPSVEIRENPSLRGKPVIVGADPKGGRGRGVVVSCSYEARKLGIRSGTPISRAFKIAPGAFYLRPNFQLYSNVSGKVMDLLSVFADKFEQVSIDEAFLDASSKLGGDYSLAKDYAEKIKHELLAKEALTCSIGVALNKSGAKIASDYKKPNGLTIVKPSELISFLSPLAIRAISGVGPKTEEFLSNKGIETIGDLQKVPGKDLVNYFGKTGVWLWGVANGLERIEVKERPMRSLNSEHTFERDVLDKTEVFEMLEGLVERLHKRVLVSNVEFRVVGMKIRFTHFQTYSRENTLAHFTTSKDAILQEIRNLFREFEKNPKKVRLVGVFVADFRELGSGEADMVSPESTIENWIGDDERK
jgi:DNA polymerase IV (archaeal DinB-like DNA polymerase)